MYAYPFDLEWGALARGFTPLLLELLQLGVEGGDLGLVLQPHLR